MNPHILLRNVTPLFLVASLLASFALAHRVEATGRPVITCNTASGFDALFNITTGVNNSAFGCEALFAETTGSDNTATGSQALFANTIGGSNTAVGFKALAGNTTGDSNTAIGFEALFRNATRAGIGGNTAVGFKALAGNTTGDGNTATGDGALQNNTTGFQNTADGPLALFNNMTGSSNIGLGPGAGFSLTTGDNNIDIGNIGVAGEANTIRIGAQIFQTATYIAGISGTTVVGDAVFVTSDGQLGVGGAVTSSARFKEEIKPMDKASEAILALKPVTFYYKKEIDPKRTAQFGLVAEEVEKVNPALITRDADGKPYTVRYEAVNAMLLNEFLKEHKAFLEEQRKVQQQEKTIAQLKKGMETVVARLKEQDSKIQKVSAQLELSKPAPQTVANNQ